MSSWTMWKGIDRDGTPVSDVHQFHEDNCVEITRSLRPRNEADEFIVTRIQGVPRNGSVLLFHYPIKRCATRNDALSLAWTTADAHGNLPVYEEALLSKETENAA